MAWFSSQYCFYGISSVVLNQKKREKKKKKLEKKGVGGEWLWGVGVLRLGRQKYRNSLRRTFRSAEGLHCLRLSGGSAHSFSWAAQ